MGNLKQKWITLNVENEILPEKYMKMWEMIQKHYSKSQRKYHNLQHLDSMFYHMNHFAGKINDKSILSFAIWFHDIIYNVLKNNNEEQSALKCKKYLTDVGYDIHRIENCVKQIQFTKSHIIPSEFIDDSDLVLLMDLDLEVLGRNWEDYKRYSMQIREEYKIYPDYLYRNGRKKALQHFIERPNIYYSSDFRINLEERARANILRELAEL